MVDKNGWHFTNCGKYTVNLGYHVEWIYPDKKRPIIIYGTHSEFNQGLLLEKRCSPKIKHFLWQLMSGCITVKKNLVTRGLKGDVCYDRCGDLDESINHVFFFNAL